MRDIYSGLSRARGHLIIISNQSSIKLIYAVKSLHLILKIFG